MKNTKKTRRPATINGQISLFGDVADKSEITVKLAGLSHDKKYINALMAAVKGSLKSITLVREPNNAADANAIRVRAYTKANGRLELGYIPRNVAKHVAPMMDAGTFIEVPVDEYKAWKPNKKNDETVVATMTLRWKAA